MSLELIRRLKYSNADQEESYSLPSSLKDSFYLMTDFFHRSATNKLCLVFPSKEYAAQWLSVPTALLLVASDFEHFKSEITESYKQYNLGDKLKLNGKAIVEWAGIKENGIAFKTKAARNSSGAIITIEFSQSIKLQRTDHTRQLSTLAKVKAALPGNIVTPTDKLLDINTYGNKDFIKNKICLVTKYKVFEKSVAEIKMNDFSLLDYSLIYPPGKIDENGEIDTCSPLLIANNLTSLALYSIANPITKIIIDGFAAILERETDFSDIDVQNIPTILITDLSEVDCFELIRNYGFEFFNFTKKNLNLDRLADNSPFYVFNNKLIKYIHFKLIKELCHDNNLETVVQRIHSIEKDDTNQDLNNLKVKLIQLTNLVSRICYVPTSDELSLLHQKINSIELLFQRNRMWLGDSREPVNDSITLLKSVIEKLSLHPSEKSSRLKVLMEKLSYDYIICPTEDEAHALRKFLDTCKIIPVSDVNDNLLTSKPLKVLITGWPKSTNMNRLLSSFLFSELTVLFYRFENNYYNSLQRRNKQNCESIKSTISKQGFEFSKNNEQSKGFDDFYSDTDASVKGSESSFNVMEFELKVDNVQFEKYRAKGDPIDSIKAKRIEFENAFFIYSSESHRFLVINELVQSAKGEKGNIHRKKVDSLTIGDVIAQINTERDILVELVEKNTKPHELSAIKQWIDLWKSLLNEHLIKVGNDFKRLVADLRKNECKKHEVTIRTWIQDENRIGPEDDSDLIAIALMTESHLLYENIKNVRDAIRKMTGLRMKASDFICDRIKTKIHEFADKSVINKIIQIEGLGSIHVLRVNEISHLLENIDVRYVNKVLQKHVL